MKILMVCLGNICRSPLAEGILRSKLNERFHIDSAGTGDWHVGNCPDKRSVSVAKKYGIDISAQRARQFNPKDFDEFDLIYVMDESNFQDVISLAKNENHKSKVKLILGDKNVPDPYYGGDEGFENVFQILDEVAAQIATKISKK
ncbi:low molecular weight protein-tyrosine-phosphatase [Moheibacter sediminis]|uniref:protein-tyrosine-phosphatase n=1 Tax=Moheibacter sediminis TaxID=1434700 RepID=A0A1W2BRC0_9FLAO|nr:low molecular weight protein-tyrosine-phosphatase [Moheibacter sediminis]SMC75439.1 protein-tyrosine phosphatase [Moheibacter sediminis]